MINLLKISKIFVVVIFPFISCKSIAQTCDLPVIKLSNSKKKQLTHRLFISSLNKRLQTGSLLASTELIINNKLSINDFIETHFKGQGSCLAQDKSDVLLSNKSIQFKAGATVDFGGRHVLLVGQSISVGRNVKFVNYKSLSLMAEKIYAPDFKNNSKLKMELLHSWEEIILNAFPGKIDNYVFKFYLKLANTLFINIDAENLKQAENLYSAINLLTFQQFSESKDPQTEVIFSESNQHLNSILEGRDIWGHKSTFLTKLAWAEAIENLKSSELSADQSLFACIQTGLNSFEKSQDILAEVHFYDKNEILSYLQDCKLSQDLKKLLAFNSPTSEFDQNAEVRLQNALRRLQIFEQIIEQTEDSQKNRLDKSKNFQLQVETIQSEIRQLKAEQSSKKIELKIENEKAENIKRKITELDAILKSDAKYLELVQSLPTHEVGQSSSVTILGAVGSGAATGGAAGGIWGAAAGAAVGLVQGVTSASKQRKAKKLKEKINRIRKQLQTISADKAILVSANNLANAMSEMVQKSLSIYRLRIDQHILDEKISSKENEKSFIEQQGEKTWNSPNAYEDFYLNLYTSNIYQFLWHHSQAVFSLQKIMSAPVLNFSLDNSVGQESFANCKLSLDNILNYNTLSNCYDDLMLAKSKLVDVGINGETYYFYNNVNYNAGHTAKVIDMNNEQYPGLLKNLRCNGKIDFTFTSHDNIESNFDSRENEEDISYTYDLGSFDSFMHSDYCRSVKEEKLNVNFSSDLKNLLIQEVAIWYEFDSYSENCEKTKSVNFKNSYGESNLLWLRPSELEEVKTIDGTNIYFYRENSEDGQGLIKTQGEDPRHYEKDNIFSYSTFTEIAQILDSSQGTRLYNAKLKYMSPLRDWEFSIGGGYSRKKVTQVTRQCLKQAKIIFLLRYLN